jgi:hypothetical protein
MGPILAQGEIGYDTITKTMYIGDGATQILLLPSVTSSGLFPSQSGVTDGSALVTTTGGGRAWASVLTTPSGATANYALVMNSGNTALTWASVVNSVNGSAGAITGIATTSQLSATTVPTNNSFAGALETFPRWAIGSARTVWSTSTSNIQTQYLTYFTPAVTTTINKIGFFFTGSTTATLVFTIYSVASPYGTSSTHTLVGKTNLTSLSIAADNLVEQSITTGPSSSSISSVTLNAGTRYAVGILVTTSTNNAVIASAGAVTVSNINSGGLPIIVSNGSGTSLASPQDSISSVTLPTSNIGPSWAVMRFV